MKEENVQHVRRRRKKKSKLGYYLYAIIILFLTIANISLAAFLLTYVQKIDITGTKISKQEEIAEWIQEDPYTLNSVYTVLKFKRGDYKLPAYLKDIKVSFKAPWALKIQVTEKESVGCMIAGEEIICFTEDGLVMEILQELPEELPLIEGIQATKVERFEKLQVENDKVFSYAVEVSEGIEKYQLAPDKIVWEGDSINLYFGEVCVRLGKSGFDDKLIQLPPILEKLVGKKGTLQMEHYDESSATISFEEYIEEPVEMPQEEPVETPQEELEEVPQEEPTESQEGESGDTTTEVAPEGE